MMTRPSGAEVPVVEPIEPERVCAFMLCAIQNLVDALAPSSDVAIERIDVLPAAVMPAVSAPAAYGVPLPVVEAIATRLRDSGKLRVADIAEFNPLYDRDGCGARVAARLCYRLLGG